MELPEGYAGRRDRAFEDARRLVLEDREGFAAAGKQLAETYSRKFAKERVGTVSDERDGELLGRLWCAWRQVLAPEKYIWPQPADSNSQPADREHAARAIILAILLAGDPRANEVIDPSICEFGEQPWVGDDDNVLGRMCIDWRTEEWPHPGDPSPAMLDKLDYAVHVLGGGRSTDDPSMALYFALNGIQTSLANLPLVRRLADHRRESRELRRSLIEAAIEIASESKGVLGPQLIESLRITDARELREAVRRTIRDTQRVCSEASRAISEGGANPADNALNPGSQIWSTQLRVAIQELESQLGILQLAVDTPDIHVEDATSNLSDLRDQLRRRRDELAASLAATSQSQQATSGASDSGSSPPDRGRQPMSASTARLSAEAIVKREGWPRVGGKPSKRRLAEKVRCSPHTLNKAVNDSALLQRTYAQDRQRQSGGEGGDELARLVAEQKHDDRSRRV
ncbi:MAG: hypothetical protein R3B57_10050 [Phycisphaerales bacterium]